MISSYVITLFAILLFSVSAHVMMRELKRSTVLQAARSLDYSRTALKIGKAYKVLVALILMLLMLAVIVENGKVVLLAEFPF